MYRFSEEKARQFINSLKNFDDEGKNIDEELAIFNNQEATLTERKVTINEKEYDVFEVIGADGRSILVPELLVEEIAGSK